MEGYLIGVDLGTSMNKAGIFNEEGKLLADAFEKTIFYYPEPGAIQQDPMDFYNSSLRLIKAVVTKSKVELRRIRCITFDSQMGGVTAVDKNGEAVIPYDSILDQRCKKYSVFIKNECEDLMVRKSGVLPTWGQKVLWWMRERPEDFAEIHKFVQPTGFVAGKMCGLKGDEAFIDYTATCWSGISDTKNHRWSEEICTILDIPMEKLPRVVKPWDIVGTVTLKAARECGIVPGIPVAAGAGDQPASLLGAGLSRPGMFVDNAGSASVFAGCTVYFNPDVKEKVLSFLPSVITGLYYPLFFLLGGLAHDWFKEKLASPQNIDKKRDEIYPVLDTEAMSVPPGSGSLFIIPHLGGRMSPWEPYYRGALFGMRWETNRKTLYRSLLESVAYEYFYALRRFRSLLPDVELKKVRVVGGGAVSDLWNQIKADVLGLNYIKLNRKDLSILGSAVIGGYGVKIFRDLESTIDRLVKETEVVKWREEYHNFYRNCAQFYCKLVDELRHWFLDLEKMSEISPPVSGGKNE